VERAFGLGEARLVFFLRKCGVWLGVDVLLLLAAKPHGRPGRACGGIDIHLGERRGGFLLGGAGATVRDQAFDGHDHGEGLDLAGDAATGKFGAHFGDLPEAIQDLFAAQFLPALSLHGKAGQVGFLIEELLLHGGTVLEHVGADTGLGFGVGGGVGVEAHGLSGIPVGHGSREDQAGKGYFLIGDEVGYVIFWHRWLRGIEKEKIGTRVFEQFGDGSAIWQGGPPGWFSVFLNQREDLLLRLIRIARLLSYPGKYGGNA
jgi:hypothetical protein